MKKILIASLLSISSAASANYVSNSFCNYLFDVVIKNETGADCRLIGQNIHLGSSRSTTLPLLIRNGETSQAYTMETELAWLEESVDMDLSFACGEDKMVSFKSKKEISKRIISYFPRFAGTAYSLSNMDATYKIEPQACYIYKDKPRPDTMIWTLR